MPECVISGIKVDFPFEPYALQTDYMAKVIECLENGVNGVLESPTGTGKTLCLLCASLAWICQKKVEYTANLNEKLKEIQRQTAVSGSNNGPKGNRNDIIAGINSIEYKASLLGVPKIIYASRTHSQIAQAMQELKRCSYNYMKAAVIGSRDQLCINSDVMKETTNSNKINMCKMKITTKTCGFYFKVESNKDSPDFRERTVMDIEDLVVTGRRKKCCPYFVSRELISDADITFMPYNYLLDPMARKANKVELDNTIIILDEAHNVEKMCEESASVEITSTEVAVCIDDVTHIMKAMENQVDMGDAPKEFTIEDLALLKEMFLNLEKAIDEINVPKTDVGETFPGSYIFDLLSQANIHSDNFGVISRLLDSLIQFLTTTSEQQNSAFRRGAGLQKILDLLQIIFSSISDDYRAKVSKCYKVHVEIEEVVKKVGQSSNDGWLQPKATSLMKKTAKKVSYWCFSPGFGMQQLLGKNTRCVILTSGTLAPLKPLISELDIPISVRLENPHIVTAAQVCVKVICQGPDKEPLLSNYENRNNPKYITSLGRTILSLCPVIPHGLLVFFTSYFLLNKCKDSWQANGLWSQIQRLKPIFVEPKSKDVFVQTMTDYYANVNDPVTKGAIFMAVCRGKVSEGLDFADINGRAVIITGLPFPPLKDPRVILKKKYLQDNRTRDNELLSGDDWYFLEAVRAVNQAIGRVIRHKDDYGAILLCDYRFNQPRQKNQLSAWIQGHLKAAQAVTFGPVIGEIARFFRNAERTLPQPGLKKFIPTIDGSPIKTNSHQQNSNNNDDRMQHFRFENKVKMKTTNEQKIEQANSVFSWDNTSNLHRPASSSYSTFPISQPQTQKADFLSRLSQEVTTIDFNNFEQNTPFTSPGLVRINKRERNDCIDLTETSPSSSSEAAASILALKKRKLKLIPNETIAQAPSSNHTMTSNSLSSTSSQNLFDISPSIPEDRKELLKLLKHSLATDHYGQFIKSLTAYQKDHNLDNLMAAFTEIFSKPCFHYLFRGMRRFIKDAQKIRFDELIEGLI